MAEAIGALRVDLAANVAQFQGDMAKVKSIVNTTATQMQRSMMTAGTAINRTAGSMLTLRNAAVVAGLALGVTFMKQAAKAGADLDDMATRLGINVERLQELSYAAQLAGVSQEDFGKALEQMNKRLGEVKAGNTAAQESLAKLGLSMADLRGKTPDEIFKLLADSISRVPNPMQQAALAAEFFSKNGVKLLPVLKDGAAGLNRYAEEARRLGFILSTETIKKAAEADDEFDRIGKSLKVAGINISAGFLPALTAIREIMTSQAFQDGVKAVAENFGRLVKWMVENRDTVAQIGAVLIGMKTGAAAGGLPGSLIGGMIGLGAATMATRTELKELDSEILRTRLDIEAAEATIESSISKGLGLFGITRGVDNAKAKLEELRAKMAELQARRDQLAPGETVQPGPKPDRPPDIDPAANAAAQQMAQTLADLQFKTQMARGEFKLFADGFPEAAHALKLFGMTGTETRLTIEALPAGLQRLNEQMLIFKGAQLTQENLAPWETYEQKLARIQQLLDANTISQDTFARANRKAAVEAGTAWDIAGASIAGSIQEAAGAFGQESSKMARIAQIAGGIQAVISMWTGAAKALELPFPANLAAWATVLATGAKAVAAIKSQKVPAFATGGAVRVDGMFPGRDSQLFQAKVMPGEQIDIWRPGEGPEQRGGGSREITINVITDAIGRPVIEKFIPALKDALADGHTLLNVRM